ncbi:hypothetical protein PanWU01x14_023740 [Parasponia andersonii]|uniref:Putative plant transposon protein domain-containing protein n=1 Tax=Parasponia andersonii TaxID=3476 RepID=A0A2P5DXM3_PARAD|nr:hypothetical protein PanWU01x14_023740 [Parasponia andersonii]
MGQLPFIAQRIQFLPLVREFYANLTDPEENTIYVRGVQVSWSEEAINAVFGLGDPVDEHSEFIENITEPELITVLETVAAAGAEWNVSAQGAYTCIRSALTPAAKVWYHFLKSRLLPTTHGKIVSKDRMLLLHSMLNGKSINVGRMIHSEIRACAAQKTGALFFPSLITRLCRNAPFLVNEEKLHNTGEIDAIAVARITQEGPTESTQQPSSSRPAAASSSRTNGDVLQQLKALEQRLSQQEHTHKQQQQFWAYSKERDTALKKALQNNFTRPIPTFPAFPQEILQDLDYEYEAESDKDGSNEAAE